MSNKVTELYNSIIENNTPEEVDRLRQLLSITKNADIDNKVCKIRILSLKEYDDNLINGTADGSIIPKNENVWHFTSTQKRGIIKETAYDANRLAYPVTYYVSLAHRDSSTVNEYTYRDIVQNNNNNQHIGTYTESVYYQSLARRDRESNYEGSFTFPKSCNVNKNTITYSQNFRVMSGAYQNGKYSAYFYLYIHMSFRPVFDFVDNNKSTNIHY